MGRDTEIAGRYAALLAGTEVGLGSALHAWHVPFSGQFLSLNQGFLLSKAVQKSETDDSFLALRISVVAAMLKSLSPAGKRLTPMLAISVQGTLFAFGHRAGGRGLGGTLLGMALLGLWAFVQPVLVYFLIFGFPMVEVAAYFLERLQRVVPIEAGQVMIGVAGLVLLKEALALWVGWLSFTRRAPALEARIEGWMRPLPRRQGEPRWEKRLQRTLGDLRQPWFLFSLTLMAVFAFVTRERQVEVVWFLLRPLAVGFLVFYSLRYLPLERWLLRLCSKQSRMGPVLARAIEEMRRTGEDRPGDRALPERPPVPRMTE